MRLILGLVMAGTALPALAEPQIRAVTLSTAGLAMIEAEAPLDAEGLRLPVRRVDIDDFLKSLRVADPAGGVPMLSMPGPGARDDTFAALPFQPADLQDLRALLDAMIGAPVEAEQRGTVIEGAVMGTRDVPCAQEGVKGCVSLALRDASGALRQIALDDALELRFADEADRDAIAHGLAALRRAARTQMVEVTLASSDTTARDVTLGWLQPAPVWKTAWRAEDDGEALTLTGWAVIENTTGQDWDAVSLSLATGAVQALEARLYDRLHRDRAPAAPEMMMLEAPMARDAIMGTAMDTAPVTMDDGESFSRFTLDQPVTLAAGEMISLPFLTETLEDARLTLYRGGTGARHPMIAIEFENPLPLRLPAGIVTLHESGRGHAGDAMLSELAPGARTTIEFARDTAMELRESTEEARRVQTGRISDGILIAEERLERRTRYRIEGAPEADRRLTLLHPLRPGWEVVEPSGELELDEMRITLDVAAGAMMAHDVVEARVTAQRVALLNLSVEDLAYWENALPDPELQARLSQMRELRAEEADLRREIIALEAEITTLIEDQTRLVGLIVQLDDDTPATRERRARVDAIDDEISAARAERRAAQARAEAIEAELRALVAGG